MDLSLFKNRTFTLFFMGNSISLFGWGCFAILSIVFSIEILNAGAKGFGLIDGAYGMRALLSTFIAIWITTKLSRKKIVNNRLFAGRIMQHIFTCFHKLIDCNAVIFYHGYQ